MKNGTASKLECGQLAELASAIIRQLPHIEGLGEVAQGWIENGAALKNALAKALLPTKKLMSVVKETASELLVNYDLTVEDLVRECGCDWNNENITSKNFPTKRTGQHKVETKTYHFNKAMGSEEVIAEMKKEGFRPAELHELLTYGIENPDEQRKYPVVALGSVWQLWLGSWDVAYLSRRRAERRLSLHCFGGGWGEGCRFLAVRES